MKVENLSKYVWKVTEDDGREFYVYYNLKGRLICSCNSYVRTRICKHILKVIKSR